MQADTSETGPDDAIAVLWGKSNAGGRVNLLLQHLLDAAAVAELLWDRYAAAAFKRGLDECCSGRGRELFVLLCGIHDVGKATPAFQCKVPELGERVRDAGLDWRVLTAADKRWHHTGAGAVIARRALRAAGWGPDAVGWVWPLVAGHHGIVRPLEVPPRRAQGRGAWLDVQDRLFGRVAAEAGVELAALADLSTPRRASQLALSGLIIMADWIASDSARFPGVDEIASVSMELARERASAAWSALDLRGGWRSEDLLVNGDDLIAARFGRPPRPSQTEAIRLASSVPEPSLLILEAPTGEGKTEQALACVEVLARRFGADGVFVGMPTQATSDPMYSRVRRWAGVVAPGVPVGLLHGKRRFNREWREQSRGASFEGVDDFDCEDLYGVARPPGGYSGPAEWFLGPKRGLLVPVTIGTIDQLLHAATRTRHVMLRHAGLAGKVVVLDEVHAYDVYMSQFLFEALRWLGDARVPVVLLSATLPPAMRRDLARAYVQGRLGRRDVDLDQLSLGTGYPSAMSVCAPSGTATVDVRTSPAWRPSVDVAVDMLEESPHEGPAMVVALLREALREGGCALVVRNTVSRAQDTFAAVRQVFGSDVVLLHARLVVGDRADRAERILQQLGPVAESDGRRPQRLIVVATQLAEQSFDVDVDLLITDVAPIDLLLQRAGRLHRHDRPDDQRPLPVRAPRMVITGMSTDSDGVPVFPRGSSYVYGEHLLLRCAAMLRGTKTWNIPAEVPGLVARGYSDDATEMPVEWGDRAACARSMWLTEQEERRRQAEEFLLAGEDKLGTTTLDGLHWKRTDDLVDDGAVAAVVRDGPPSVEVIAVRRDADGFMTLDGRRLGVNGEAVVDDTVMERVQRSMVRLPPRPELTQAAEQELRPLPAWTDPWLRHARALILDENMTVELGGRVLRYDHDLGLLDRPQHRRA